MINLNQNQLRHATRDGCKKMLIYFFILIFNNAITQINVDNVDLKNEIKRVTKNTEFEIGFFENIRVKPYTMIHLFPEWSFKDEVIHEDVVVFYVSRKKYIYYFLYNFKTKCFISSSMTFHNFRDRFRDPLDLFDKFYGYNFCLRFQNNCCAEFY
jgi:hypothetical protein